MPRRNHNPRGRSRSSLIDRYDTDYISLPEYPQYNSIVAIPLKAIFYNIDAAPGANDFYVAKHYGDPVLRKLAKKIENGVSA